METWTKEKVGRFQCYKRVKPQLCVSKRWGHDGLTSPYWLSAVRAGNNSQARCFDRSTSRCGCTEVTMREVTREGNSKIKTSKGDFWWDAVPPSPTLLPRETEPTQNREQRNPHGMGQQAWIHLETENTELFVFKSSQSSNFSSKC